MKVYKENLHCNLRDLALDKCSQACWCLTIHMISLDCSRSLADALISSFICSHMHTKLHSKGA